jgi:hypothetical protein
MYKLLINLLSRQSFHYTQAHMEMENKGFTKIKTDTPYRYNIFISLRHKKKLLNAESEQTLSTSNS